MELLERERFLEDLATALRLVAGGAGRTVLSEAAVDTLVGRA